MNRSNLVSNLGTRFFLRGVGCDALGFQLRIIDANDLVNPVKRVNFGQIWVNLGHDFENLANNN
jgi:hypothetical protein